MVQWLRLHAPNTGGLGSIPGPRLHKTKSSHAATKIQRSEINKSKKKKKEKMAELDLERCQR